VNQGRHLFVKVCGITRPEDAVSAAEAGADAVGFVFHAASPRAVTPARAREIGRELGPSVLRVGVFVDAPADVLARIAGEASLDLLQLHGSEPPEAFASLPCRALKAVKVARGFVARDALRYEGRAAGVLLDAGEGAGVTFDWSLGAGVRQGAAFLIVAGGLGPENVAGAIAALRPDGVDASSRLESAPGVKDGARVRAFVSAVRAVHQ
jgi:phosphoribosylanthranilate isomerase